MYIPIRTCVGCRKKQEKTRLIRITCLDNLPIIDRDKKYDGRAIYVCPNDDCICMIQKNKAIERFLKVIPNENFYQNLKNAK